MLSGILRFYYTTDEGQEFNKAFYSEQQIVGPLSATIIGEASRYSIEVIEACDVFVISESLFTDYMNKHFLTLSPPLNLNPKWFKQCGGAYTIAKYGMSMCVLGMAEEFKQDGIAVNALWPKTTISTAAIKNMPGSDSIVKASRTPLIMADAAYEILTKDSQLFTGNFVIDEEILRESGVTNFSKYREDPSTPDDELFLDFYLD